MSNLHSLSAIAKQRKKRTLWRNLVVCFAALVVFCTTYALILPAITMEQEGYSCGLQEHTHTSDCYQLVCGKQELFSHTHTKPDCYDANGNLTCTLKEQTLHHHASGCYSSPQPVCGLAEAAPHAHEDVCYTEGELTCTLAETQGHTHSQDCYPADFQPQLICGQQELPEHRHTAACYTLTCQQQEHTHTESCISSHQAFLNSIQETPQETTQPEEANQPEEVTQPEAVTEPQEATQPEEATLPEEVTLPEEATQPEEVTQPEDVTQPEEATEPQEPTQPETVTEPQEPPQEEEPILPGAAQPPVMLLASAAPATVAENAENTGSVELVSVGKSITVNSNPTEYVPTEGKYKINLALSYSLTVAQKEGKGYITNGTDGTDCGKTFTMCLGELGAGAEIMNTPHMLMDGGNVAGTYTLTKRSDGKVYLTVTYHQDYVEKASGSIHTNLSLNGSIDKKFSDKDGNIKYPMDGEVKLEVQAKDIKYPDGHTNSGSMSVAKEGAYSISADGSELSYKVTVSGQSTDGTPGKIDITDTMTITGANVTGLKSIIVDGQAISADRYTYQNNNGTLTLNVKGLDKLSGWSSHTIEYVYSLDSKLQGGTQVGNTVKASSTPDGGGLPLEVEKTIQTKAYEEDDPNNPLTPDVEKSNNWNDSMLNSQNPVISWTVTVNKNKQNIAGKTLEDSMMMANKDSLNLRVQVDDSDVAQADFATYFTVGEDGKLTFTEAANGKKITLTYDTPAPEEFGTFGTHKVSNTARIGGKIATSEAHSNSGNLEKKYVRATDDQGRIVMEWEVTVTVAKDGLPADVELVDYTNPDWTDGNGNHFYDKNSVEVRYQNTLLTCDTDYQLVFWENTSDNGQVEKEHCSVMKLKMLKDPCDKLTLTGNEKLVVKYKTYVPKDSTETSFKNRAWYRDKQVDAYTEIKPNSFQKLGTNGQPTENTFKDFNGELSWTIKAVVGTMTKTSTLHIKDTLPLHVQVQSATIKEEKNWQQKTLTLTSTISDTLDTYTITGSFQKSGEGEDAPYILDVTITAPDGQEITPGTAFEIKLNCKVDEDYLNANLTGSLENKAEGEMGKIKLTPTSQTQSWDNQTEEPVLKSLTKGGVWNKNSQTIDYTVTINPKGEELQPESAKLYVTDEFIYNPERSGANVAYELLRGSVKLYKAVPDASGNLTPGEAITDWRWTADEDDPGANAPFADVTKILRMEVPDSTPLILKYSYQLVQHTGDSFQVEASNKVYLNTKPVETQEEKQVSENWSQADTQGSVITGRVLTITKVEEGNSAVAIADTHFQVFAYDPTTQQWSTTPVQLTKDGQTFTDYVTDAHGNVLVEPAHGFQEGILYRLVETQAAPGYSIPATPPSVKFHLGNLPEELDSALTQDAIDLSQQGASKDITNVPDSAKFSVIKRWLSHTGQDVTASRTDSVQLELWQIATEKQQDVVVNDPLISTSTVTVKITSSASNGNSGDVRVVPKTVKKGSAVEVTVTLPDYCTADAKAYIEGKGGFWWNSWDVAKTVNGNTYTFRADATFNFTMEIMCGTTADKIQHVISPATGTSSPTTGGTTPSTEYKETQLEYSITLSAANNWTWNSKQYEKDTGKKLPIHVTTEDGKAVWYSYYVVENTSVPYEVTYSPSKDGKPVAITSGTITVTNTLPPPPADVSVTVKKEWAGLKNWADLETVNCELFQKTWASQAEFQAAQENAPLDYHVTYGMTEEQIAALANGTLKRVEAFTLNSGDGWTWSKSNLPGGADGKYYTYFVVEEPSDYYTVTYSPQVHDGVITVTNTTEKKPTEIQVNKQWFNHLAESTDAPTGTDSVEFTLYRIAQVDGQPVEGQTEYGPFSLTKVGNWKWDSTTAGLKLLAMEYINGQTYTYSYYVQEIVPDPEKAGYKATYGIVDDMAGGSPTVIIKDELTPIQSGTLVIRNTLDSPKYQLPQTGGTGTAPLRLAGLTLALTAACLLHRKRKTRPQ